MRDDVLLNKIAEMERCLKRIEEEYFGFEKLFEKELRRQDSVVLNLTRACENAIDLANHLVKTRHLGIPQNSRDSFEILSEAGLLSPEICTAMKDMVGFRNIAIHSYTRLNINIIRSIVESDLHDFHAFKKHLLDLAIPDSDAKI